MNAHLETYLNDHLAGSNSALDLYSALDLLTRLEENYANMTRDLAEVRAVVQEDQKELKTIMARLHLKESQSRKVSGWLAEKVAQLKLKVDDPGSSSLYLLESLEILALGIQGKLALWRALSVVAADNATRRVADYEQLAKRAKEQHRRVEDLRLQAAKMAFE
jgi:hypothetical protein